jgi:hypothetical protein
MDLYLIGWVWFGGVREKEAELFAMENLDNFRASIPIY